MDFEEDLEDDLLELEDDLDVVTRVGVLPVARVTFFAAACVLGWLSVIFWVA